MTASPQRPDLLGADEVFRVRPYGENNPEAKAVLPGFAQGLSELGWIDGRNLRMDLRWSAGNADRMRMFAKELVDL
jgi:putative tryptophan/tyrosine transport system substrate-binding protein